MSLIQQTEPLVRFKIYPDQGGFYAKLWLLEEESVGNKEKEW